MRRPVPFTIVVAFFNDCFASQLMLYSEKSKFRITVFFFSTIYTYRLEPVDPKTLRRQSRNATLSNQITNIVIRSTDGLFFFFFFVPYIFDLSINVFPLCLISLIIIMYFILYSRVFHFIVSFIIIYTFTSIIDTRHERSSLRP